MLKFYMEEIESGIRYRVCLPNNYTITDLKVYKKKYKIIWGGF